MSLWHGPCARGAVSVPGKGRSVPRAAGGPVAPEWSVVGVEARFVVVGRCVAGAAGASGTPPEGRAAPPLLWGPRGRHAELGREGFTPSVPSGCSGPPWGSRGGRCRGRGAWGGR